MDHREPTLLVIRHAKSDWGTGLPDAERPLNKRGRRDAPAVGRWLAEQGLDPDWAGISPSVRTQQTWRLLAEAAGFAVPAVTLHGLYLAGLPSLVEAVRSVPGSAGTAALVIHSPGCVELVDWLTAGAGDEAAQTAMRQKFPTGAVARVRLSVDWPSVVTGTGVLEDFAVLRG